MEERKPHFAGKALSTGLNGLRIAVDREHAALPTHGLEDLCRMTAAPKRRIDIVPARFQGQSRERLIDEHGCVLNHVRSGSSPPPEESPPCLSMRAPSGAPPFLLSRATPRSCATHPKNLSAQPTGPLAVARLERQRIELGRQIGRSLFTLQPEVAPLAP